MLNLTKNPEAGFRYLPVINDLKKRVDNSSTILEVGGGDFNLVNFWPRQITVFDLSFNSAVKNKLVTEFVQTSDAFPFSSNSFDFVVCLDTLEHVLPKNRQIFLKEMARVCKQGLYLGFPCGELAAKQDERLLALSNQQFIREHVNNGLPDEAGVIRNIKDCGMTLVWVRKNLNLVLREYLMRLWLSSFFLSKLLFKVCGFLAPFYYLLSFGNCYRRIFFFEKRPL